MRIVRMVGGLVLAIGVLLSGTALAQSGEDPIVIIEVGDPMDQRLIDYVVSTIGSEPAHAFVLKIDSPGVSSGDLGPLFDAVVGAPAPVISWIGPNPAVAYGGSAYLANHADIRSAAPGLSLIHISEPTRLC